MSPIVHTYRVSVRSELWVWFVIALISGLVGTIITYLFKPELIIIYSIGFLSFLLLLGFRIISFQQKVYSREHDYYLAALMDEKGKLSKFKDRSYFLSKSKRRIKDEIESDTTPKLFYYLDKASIKSLNNQISGGSIPIEQEVEKTTSKDKKIGVDKIISGSYDRSETERMLKRYKTIETDEERYKNVERFLLNTDSLLFGLEDFEYDRSAEEEFITISKRIKEDYDFEMPGTVIDAFKSHNQKRYTVDAKVKEFETASGYAILRTNFFVSKIEKGYSIFVINPYKLDKDKIGNLKIEMICSDEVLTDYGKEVLKDAKKVNATILGNVIGYNKANYKLSIRPLAVY